MHPNLLSPSSTIFRVRRKRSADPLAGLVVMSKKQRTGDAESAPMPDVPSTSNGARSDANSAAGDKDAREVFFLLAGTSDRPGGKEAVKFLDQEHKVVEMVDYSPEDNQLGDRRISVLDRQYLEVMEAANAISNIGIGEQERRDFERESTAPLAAAEMDDEDLPSTSAENKEFVYDFYCPADSKTYAGPNSNYEVRLPTDEELQLYFGGDDEGDSDAADDDEDSNDENYYKNDYPDEGQFDSCENDTTSDDDSYDHYGDETVEYGGICHDSDIDD